MSIKGYYLMQDLNAATNKYLLKELQIIIKKDGALWIYTLAHLR